MKDYPATTGNPGLHRDFLDENDYPPTIRDIQAELGISSTSVVDYNLKVLESHNLIRRNRNISRGIELVNRGTGRRKVVAIPLIVNRCRSAHPGAGRSGRRRPASRSSSAPS